MRPMSMLITTLGLAATLAPVPAIAQQADAIFTLRAGATKTEFKTMTGELGSALRFRPIADPRPLGRGAIDLSVEFANTRIDDLVAERSVPAPHVAARFGVSDRVDLVAWGGYDSGANYGVAGAGTSIALLTQGGSSPVSLAIRPTVTSLIGPSELWIGNASIDVSLSRAIGNFSPYIGAAASGSMGIERSTAVTLDPVFADHSVTYAGVAYRWRALMMAAEVEKGDRVSYGLRLGARF